MEPIHEGMSGIAVEDVQDRLASLGYAIDTGEREGDLFGPSTASAVARFRADHFLPAGDVVDTDTWSELVDECYHMGDRTLYLRLPNFHGNDVRTVQTALSILGFSCGAVDGYFGAHTEAAVKQFQENVGMFADGMCFQDTFRALWRLYHVWGGKEANVPPDPMGIGFARAASVLEESSIALFASDPVGRTVASRIWNLASATSENSGLVLLNDGSEIPEGATAIFELVCEALAPEPGITTVRIDEAADLPRRIRTSYAASRHKPPYVRIQLPASASAYDGTFTANSAQTIAGLILDGICAAFDEQG